MKGQKQSFASYNSLARRPLIGGIPVLILVIGCALMLVTAFAGGLTLGIKGLVFPALIAAFLLYVRIRCLEDSRAAEDIKWEIKALISQIQCKSNVVSYTSLDDDSLLRKKNVSEFFKNHPDIK